VSTAAIAFLTFLGGTTVGAIAAAWFTSAERARERMVDAADAFLVAVAEAREALWAITLAANELREAKDDMDAFLPVAKAAIEEFDQAWAAGESTDAIPDAYKSALHMVARFTERPAVISALDTQGRAEAALLLQAAQDTVLAMRDEKDNTALVKLGPVVRDVLRKQARFMTAIQGRTDTPPVLHAALYRVHAAVARVTLTFPAAGGQVSDVATKAETVKQSLLAAQAAMNSAMLQESDPLSDAEVVRNTQASNDAQIGFALSANREIAKWRWPWKKYGD
jgi:hypothetical protein